MLKYLYYICIVKQILLRYEEKKSLRDALAQGVIASICKDIGNNSVFCYTELGSFFGAYSYSYYKKVYNSLDMPIPLKVVKNILAYG